MLVLLQLTAVCCSHYTIFGVVLEGMEVVEEVNALSKGRSDNTAGREAQALIEDSGQLR